MRHRILITLFLAYIAPVYAEQDPHFGIKYNSNIKVNALIGTRIFKESWKHTTYVGDKIPHSWRYSAVVAQCCPGLSGSQLNFGYNYTKYNSKYESYSFRIMASTLRTYYNPISMKNNATYYGPMFEISRTAFIFGINASLAYYSSNSDVNNRINIGVGYGF